MIDVKSLDYYNRLDIQESATDAQIKEAFFRLVREYTPQTSPEDYKLIREAYDVLKNPLTRADHDSRRKYGPEIERLNHDLDQAFSREDWQKAEYYLKKLINLQPKNALLHRHLGHVYRNQVNYRQGAKEFEAACAIDSNESSYLVDAADSYRNLKEYAKAESLYYKAIKMDESNFDAPRNLAAMYWWDMDRKNEAITLLQESIDRDGKLDFQDFFFIFDLLSMHMFSNQIAQMKKRLNQLELISTKNEDLQMVSGYIPSLIEVGIKNYYFAESAVLYDFLSKMTKEASLSELSKILKQTHAFGSDEANLELIRFVVNLLTVSYFDLSTDEEDELYDKYIEAVTLQLSVTPLNQEVIQAVNNLRGSYPELFNLNKTIYQSILDFRPSEFSSSCPHCQDRVTTPLNEFGNYTCPHCNKGFDYGSFGYSSQGGYSSGGIQAPAGNSGCLVSIISSFVTVILVILIGCSTLI